MINYKEIFPTFNKELLDDIEKYADIKYVPEGEVILSTGQYIKSSMIVLNGKIKIYRDDIDGGEFFMYYINPGQACAISMVCAMQSEKSQVKAIAVEDSELLIIPLKMMEKWMSEYKSWSEFVVGTYRNRFEELLVLIDQIAFRSMDERLEFYLKRQYKDSGSLIINISHQKIASDLNSTREVISRLLKKMEQRGLLKLSRNNIELEKKLLQL